MRPKIGILTVSDRASHGVYADQSGPAIEAVLRDYLATECDFEKRVIADERDLIAANLRELAALGCCLVCTTGGTGPAVRDVTPEAIADCCQKELPGFGEQMRAASLRAGVPTAILSRQTAAILDRTLVVTLPGKPASVRVCLDAVFPAIPYCIDLLGGPHLLGNPAVVQVFRPTPPAAAGPSQAMTMTPPTTDSPLPASPLTKEQFVALLRPLANALRAVAVDAPDAAAQAERLVPFAGPAVAAVRQAALASLATEWLLPKAQAGIRFGRVAKDLDGFSVDAVLMAVPGPRHRHPNGEIDLCFATQGEPKFDNHPAGWVVYGKDSAHVPTVRGGEMLILYFLPGGAIEFG